MCLCPVLLCSLLPWFSGVRFYCLSPLIKMCIFFFFFFLAKCKWQTPKEEKETEKQEKYFRGNVGMSGSPTCLAVPQGG